MLQNRLPMLRAFSRDFGTDILRPRATVQVEKSGTAATGQTNPTNYESGDTTNTNVEVSVNELSQSFHVTSQELMQGHKLETKADNNLRALADDIWDTCAALFNVATSGYSQQIIADWSSDPTANRATVWANIAKSPEKHLILDGSAYSEQLPTNLESFNPSQNGAYGWDGLHLCTKWDASGLEANAYGLAVGPNAMAVASGLPELSGPVRNQVEAVRSVFVPDLGITVQLVLWGSSATRATWVSYGVMFGAAAGDTTAASIIVTS